MNIKNNKDPHTDSWGTPKVILCFTNFYYYGIIGRKISYYIYNFIRNN